MSASPPRAGAAASDRADHIRYQPNEKPPIVLAAGLGLQISMLAITAIVITPVIVFRTAGFGEADLVWPVFATLIVSGISTALQAVKIGRVGAGHVLLMGTSGAFIAISVAALQAGGAALLATLVIASSLFQFVLAYRLAWIRRIVTPTVAGTVIMLIAVAVMPIMFPLFNQVPETAPGFAAPLSCGTALLVIVALALRGTGAWRLWAPMIGVAAGTIVGAVLGIIDLAPIGEAVWIGVPSSGFPGFDLSFGAAFWGLLPGFVFVTLIGAIETIGDSVAIQQVSWREKRAPDYRVVGGAVAADGVGNFLSGLLGTVPNTTYSSSVSITELTGVAARRVGLCIGVTLFLLAFSPKVAAVFIAIPSPVAGAFGFAVIAILFTLGMRMVLQEGMNLGKATIVGVSFWIGAGFQSQAIYPDKLGGWAATLLENGMVSGGLVAMSLMLLLELTGARPKRLDTAFDQSAGTKIKAFLSSHAERKGWNERSVERLVAAGEEALLTLTAGQEERAKEVAPEAEAEAAAEAHPARRLRLTTRTGKRAAELEFVASAGGTNLEDQLTLMTEYPDGVEEGEISLRLLRHYASSVRHQKYHDMDVITVHVDTTP